MINPLDLLKNMENIQEKMKDFTSNLSSIKATGYAMGNMIEVSVNGSMVIESLKIDPSLCKESQCEMLEVLIASAVNNAFDNVKKLVEEDVRKRGSGLGLGI